MNYSISLKSTLTIGQIVKGLLSSTLAFPIRATRPLLNLWHKLIYQARLKSQVGDIHPTVQVDGMVNVIGSGEITIGHGCRFSQDVELGTADNGRIRIGREVRINRGTTIFAYDKLSIGDHTMLGEFVTVRDANHGIAPDRLIRSQSHDVQMVEIGSDVWIGRGTVILPGVSLGDGCVIGANSVVTRSISAGAVAVGSPARIIKQR